MRVADGNASAFCKKMGFARAGWTEAMWIYAGRDSCVTTGGEVAGLRAGG
jgi:hypothetical protein